MKTIEKQLYHILCTGIVVVVFSCTTGGSKHQETNPTEKGSVTEVYSEVYENGQVKIKGSMVDGKRHGLWVSYFENGLKWSEENYYMGVKDGRTISYFPNGMLRYRGTYVDDSKAGIWTFYDEEGQIVKEMDFNEK